MSPEGKFIPCGVRGAAVGVGGVGAGVGVGGLRRPRAALTTCRRQRERSPVIVNHLAMNNLIQVDFVVGFR